MKKIKLFNIYKFELPLKNELNIKNNKLYGTREGLLINIETNEGLSGFGEISPLPFFHSESFKDAVLQVNELRQNSNFLQKIENLLEDTFKCDLFIESKNMGIKIPKKESNREVFEKGFTDFLFKLNSVFSEINFYPSVRTGIEMAIISLVFFNPGLEKILQSIPDPNLPVCKLIIDLKKDLKKEMTEIIKNEFKTIKIKVGRGFTEDESDSIKKIRMLIIKNHLENVVLRIDANGLWSLKEAIYFGKSIGTDLIEYMEDPLSKISEYEQFFKETQIPIALDEKLLELIDLNKINEENWKRPDYLKAIIIKPDHIGGFYKTASLIYFAKKYNIKTVLSNSFNSSLLVSFIALFAGIMNMSDVALGLDTLKLFDRNLIAEDIEIVKGRINILEIFKNIKKINYNLLSSVGF